MNIRHFEGVADARAILRTNVLAWREAYRDLLPAAVLAERDPEPAEDPIREYADQLRADRDGIYVAEVDGAVRGYSYFRWGEETKSFVGENEAGLKEIYVAPDHWGQGVGTALLERGLEDLPERIDRLKLEMLDGNDLGHRFYAARGFERTGSDEFEIAGKPYPTAIYTLEL
ncbi:GNAT family N-acetyltransferase [Natronorubrum sp. JWXQ-INN-674]|uniref:GNAT family N-acetyltransferase n=1 Tax=Natronorubrum halalkaliphilum TaxID=2691917 RepID=A0A6B0VPI1_9EURY|nr:GNAT family N-acetyltransferase [Natronorubrum halalkaliphilum]MXV63037.1 GNAT family N-acetyltransferase [Natronorubrum halalkaliphilum]